MTSVLVVAQAMKSGAWQQCSHMHLVLQHTTIASVLPRKLVAAVFKALRKQMVLDRSTNQNEMAFARLVPTCGSLQSCSRQDVRERWSTGKSTASTLWRTGELFCITCVFMSFVLCCCCWWE